MKTVDQLKPAANTAHATELRNSLGVATLPKATSVLKRGNLMTDRYVSDTNLTV